MTDYIVTKRFDGRFGEIGTPILPLLFRVPDVECVTFIGGAVVFSKGMLASQEGIQATDRIIAAFAPGEWSDIQLAVQEAANG